MTKKLLPLAVAALIAAPAAQAADVTVYGLAHVALSTYDVDSAVNSGADYWDLSSHASRLGVKGSEDLGNGLKAIFKMEMQVRIADADNDINNGDAGSISMRNGYVGLAGDWGTFLMGRHDTPYKISTGKLDLFGDTIADYNGNGADSEEGGHRALGFIDVRADNAIAYVSPNMNGFTVAAAIVTPGNSTVTGADNNAADDLAEAFSIAGMYSNGPFFASLAYEEHDDELVSGAAGDGFDMWRLGLGYTANNFHAGFVYEDVDTDVANADNEKWQLSASYAFGNNVVKVAYGERDGGTASYDSEQWSLGFDHKMSKRTKVYAVYTDVDDSAAGRDWSGFSAGMVHKF